MFFLKSGLSYPCAGLSISILQIVEDRLLGPEIEFLIITDFCLKKYIFNKIEKFTRCLGPDRLSL